MESYDFDESMMRRGVQLGASSDRDALGTHIQAPGVLAHSRYDGNVRQGGVQLGASDDKGSPGTRARPQRVASSVGSRRSAQSRSPSVVMYRMRDNEKTCGVQLGATSTRDVPGARAHAPGVKVHSTCDDGRWRSAVQPWATRDVDAPGAGARPLDVASRPLNVATRPLSVVSSGSSHQSRRSASVRHRRALLTQETLQRQTQLENELLHHDLKMKQIEMQIALTKADNEVRMSAIEMDDDSESVVTVSEVGESHDDIGGQSPYELSLHGDVEPRKDFSHTSETPSNDKPTLYDEPNIDESGTHIHYGPPPYNLDMYAYGRHSSRQRNIELDASRSLPLEKTRDGELGSLTPRVHDRHQAQVSGEWNAHYKDEQYDKFGQTICATDVADLTRRGACQSNVEELVPLVPRPPNLRDGTWLSPRASAVHDSRPVVSHTPNVQDRATTVPEHSNTRTGGSSMLRPANLQDHGTVSHPARVQDIANMVPRSSNVVNNTTLPRPSDVQDSNRTTLRHMDIQDRHQLDIQDSSGNVPPTSLLGTATNGARFALLTDPARTLPRTSNVQDCERRILSSRAPQYESTINAPTTAPDINHLATRSRNAHEDTTPLMPPGPDVNLNSSPANAQIRDIDHNKYSYHQINNDNIGVLLEQQRDIFRSMASTMHTGLNMPKAELLSFDGDPLNYFKFVSSFDTNIDSITIDDKMKLNYLIQYCRGEAKEAISDCVIMDPHDGYLRARAILAKQYGRPHIIAQSHLRQIVNGPTLKPYDHESLQKLSSQMERCEITLTQMGYVSDINNTETLLSIAKRFPMHMRAKWVDKADFIIETGREPTFSDLTQFVENAARVTNTMYGQELLKNAERPPQGQHYGKAQRATTLAVHGNNEHRQHSYNHARSDEMTSCIVCRQQHRLWQCPTFTQMPLSDRKEVCLNHKLCFNCLLPGHFSRDCRRRSFCNAADCTSKHNILLHEQMNDEKKVAPIKDDQANNFNVTTSQTGKRVTLKVVPVTVQAFDGGPYVETYALLDECSDVTLCSTQLTKQLGILGKKTSFTITTINTRSVSEGTEVQLLVKDLGGHESVELNRVWTIDKIPISEKSIPTRADIVGWPHLQDVRLPELKCKDVLLLIGSDVPQAFWNLEERRGRRNEPYAVKSVLGWTLIGPTQSANRDDRFNVNFTTYEDETLSKQVERFWTTEFNDHASPKTAMSVNDKTAAKIMEDSVMKVNGHYEIRLPWRHTPPTLPESKTMAEARLRCLKRKLMKDKDLHNKYKDTMADYITKGYATKVDRSTSSSYSWYVPHHPVYNVNKPDKIRIVFDCGATSKGTSLNEQLLHGPDLTNQLVGVLLRFRQEKIALVADVEAMFHQVRVNPQDCDALRCLWWPEGNLNRPPEDYKMQVHLFGATSSPSCAGFALKRAALDGSIKYSQFACETVHKNFYVDDCLASVESEEEAITLCKELTCLLGDGGFRLTKWASNSRKVMSTIDPNERSKSVVDLNLPNLPVERALGVYWNMESDTIQVKTTEKNKPITRRGILSVISSVYDPLGLVSPVVLRAKLILQELCKNNARWDEALEEGLMSQWKAWLQELAFIGGLNIERCYKPPGFGAIVSTQLHHFSDASSTGYGCVSYIRNIDNNGRVHCSFVMGKSRLAPLKSVSIPRLELSAAVVAVNMDGIIKEELDVPINETFFWTDSTSVIQYIENKSTRFKTFVANRLSIIHGVTDISQWHYVDTKQNPADHASRGFGTNDASKVDVWLHGPRFLWKNEDLWPKRPTNMDYEIDRTEVKSDEMTNTVTVNLITNVHGLDDLLDRYSKWYSLQKAVAWLLRYRVYCNRKYRRDHSKELQTGPLSIRELRSASLRVIAYIQSTEYKSEITSLKKSEVVSKSSSLRKLYPILQNDVLRVGGRLTNANLGYDNKHPVILPKKSNATKLIVSHYHVTLGHSSTNHVLSHIRRKYWIVKGHSTVKRILQDCFQCKRQNAQPAEQLMAQLPNDRLIPDKPPFTYVGVDYFGPLLVKIGRRTEKRYGCLFTCLTTRAVHIEIAHSLSTDSFLSAFGRFVSRRGTPEKVRSDNGTNFVGGEKEHRNSIASWNQGQITDTLRQREIEWTFNAPTASHHGGVWERMIRSTRKVMKAILVEQLITDETLLTTVAEVEKILNDRPLTKVSGDARDDEPLTPNKLILTRTNQCLPPGVFVKTDMYIRRWWKQAQYLANVFWKRWIREYLPMLQERQRWTVPKRNMQVNDIVLVVDDSCPRGRWPLARVVEVYPGMDGHVRTVKIFSQMSYKIRPIAKLCFLESG